MNAGERAKELVDLVRDEMEQCGDSDVNRRIIANRLLEFLAPWNNPPEDEKPKAKAKAKKASNKQPIPWPDFDLTDEPDSDLSDEVKEAISIAEEIEELAGELPEDGAEFGQSVSEKAADIAGNIERHNRVTNRQRDALDNMLAGIQAWTEH